MEKTKLLFIARDDSHYTVRATHYFIHELSKITDLMVSHESGNIEDLIAKCRTKPDFIYLHDYKENGAPIIEGVKNLKIPYAIGLHDLHYQYPNRKAVLMKEGIKYIFTYCQAKFIQWYPEFSNGMKWLPHHAHLDIFKDYGLPKDIDLLMTGAAFEDYYPLRAQIIKRFENKPEFVRHKHPGYRNVEKNESNVIIGDDYAKEINRAKICFTCDSIYKYPIKKYFEVPACNTLLLAPFSDELHKLGFIPGVNFVSINENNFEEKADYYLEHEEERKKIALNGMRLIQQKHSTRQRVIEFMEKIGEILEEKQITSTDDLS
ncbi:glycosyltransferase [Priestia filamentosa]|uniref:glycosyltransferase family protein n=1 Tax=Priestia filamentosa TaxID=1402861 RepID=UPI00397AEFE7